jgi:hypothetical protein
MTLSHVREGARVRVSRRNRNHKFESKCVDGDRKRNQRGFMSPDR